MGARSSSETFVFYNTLHYVTTQWRWRQHGPPKRWYPTTSLRGVTTQWRWRQHDPPKRWFLTVSLHGVATLKTATPNY